MRPAPNPTTRHREPYGNRSSPEPRPGLLRRCCTGVGLGHYAPAGFGQPHAQAAGHDLLRGPLPADHLGNGRYIFYLGQTWALNLDQSFRNLLSLGWYRYDMATGATEDVWNYSTSTPVIQNDPSLNWGASVSNDGNVFAAFAGSIAGAGNRADQLYVWRQNTGDVRLASINSQGGATSSNVSYPVVSGDGSYLFFEVEADADMPGHTDPAACPSQKNDITDLYRFNVQAGTESVVTFHL